MGRRRTKSDLPPYVYETNGAFYYRRGPHRGPLGKDRDAAIAEAVVITATLGKGVVIPEEHSMIYSPDLLTEKAVVDGSVPLTDACGIYFLLYERRIVYVGQSVNCRRRISQHEASKDKTFDAYHILPCAQTELDMLESLYVARFKPQFNQNMPGTVGWAQAKGAHEEKWTRRPKRIFPKPGIL